MSNQEEQEQINKWVEQCEVFNNFDKTVQDVGEYLTRQLKVFSMLLDNGNYDQANKFAEDLKKYGNMFRVLSEYKYLVYKDHIKNNKLSRKKGDSLTDHIEKMWSNRFNANYCEDETKYIVIKY